ncbi:hypothetical protein D9758_001751 [Tetrapyrgos nigripes]|uniref:protein-tyrosine-phosphatase n=1 Tax=Tetrapyrgos nigripes TaxID=182062 RepID=A0A8H5GX55_9AGAR|nr:hypothetical protein D9758_001751 [Tetrapyrgos nigripes]
MGYPVTPSFDEILKNKLYIGNLATAKSSGTLAAIGITHIVSVCQELSSTGPKHLAVAVADCEYDDLLIHLPSTCQFIQQALDEGGRVLVHCVMGISRSATVAAAYSLGRPCIQPNYGFIKQLDAFEDCAYSPSTRNAVYVSWKRKQGQKVTAFLNQMIDTVAIIPNQLFLSSEFPDDAQQAESLMIELGIFHLVSVSPFTVPHLRSTVQQFSIDDLSQDALLVTIPQACNFIREAIANNHRVLVYSDVECKAAIVVCCYLMCTQNLNPNEAHEILGKALPLFHRTANFSRHLELFGACGFAPSSDHPLVKEWVGESSPLSCTPKESYSKEMAAAITATAMASVLSDTSIDIGAFGETLKKIQHSCSRNDRVPATAVLI